MSVKIISNNKKRVTLEVSIDLDSENFLETEELIMKKVNEMGQKITEEALKNLEIKETVIAVNEQKLYAKEVKKISNTLRRNRSKKKSICSIRRRKTGLSH
jgi:galactokinase/mevalonate kinase-like predicted kinase